MTCPAEGLIAADVLNDRDGEQVWRGPTARRAEVVRPYRNRQDRRTELSSSGMSKTGDETDRKVHEAVQAAVENAAQVLEVLYDSPDPDAALIALRERFGWDELQAQVVLNMQFRRVTRSEREAVAHRLRRPLS